MRRFISLALMAAVAGCTAGSAGPEAAPPPLAPTAEAGTRILDRDAAAKLLAADGITLQWIGWNERGHVRVRDEGGTIRLTGSQAEPGGQGRLFVDGKVTEIGADYFTFDGVIRIVDTPDPGRRCEADKTWHFAITQNRPYWRLREFEWCDGLTDYVDIYMPGTKP